LGRSQASLLNLAEQSEIGGMRVGMSAPWRRRCGASVVPNALGRDHAVDRSFQMMSAITVWCVGPALAAGPQLIGKTARRQAPRQARGLEPVETAAALHLTASFRQNRLVQPGGACLQVIRPMTSPASRLLQLHRCSASARRRQRTALQCCGSRIAFEDGPPSSRWLRHQLRRYSVGNS
jgi:hypothetical protein